MKPFYLSIILFCATLSMAASAQTTTDQLVGNYINNNEWFKLREIYQAEGDSLTPMLHTFAQSMIYHNFNRPDSASTAIAELINKYSNEIGSENILNMSYLLAANEYKAGRFASAAKTLQSVIDRNVPFHNFKRLLQLHTQIMVGNNEHKSQ